MRRRALVVDDEVMVAALVRDALVGAGFDVELALTADAASEALADFDPDVAILDIALGRGPTGIDLAYLVRHSYPATAVLMLTRYPDLRTTRATSSQLPPDVPFLSKDMVTSSTVLVDAVEAAISESRLVLDQVVSSSNPLAVLTPTQLSVLHMAAQGFTTTEIARRRNCSPSGVEKVLAKIYQRLNIVSDEAVHPRVEAIRIYIDTVAVPVRDCATSPLAPS